jgi:hypothetical protein
MSTDRVDLTELAARVNRLEDIEAIKNLLARFAQGADDGNNLEIMLPLFSDDVVFEIDNMDRLDGKAAIAEMLRGSPAFIRRTLHYMISPAIEPAEDGRTARATWYLWETAEMPQAQTKDWEAVWIGGTYDAELVKTAAGWKFARLRLRPKIMSPYSEGWVKTPIRPFVRR